MQRDALLTQDELDFIQTMQHNPQLNVRDATSSLLVNGGSQIRDLLTRLAAHEQVTIQANFENQQMTFPLHLVEDEFHALHLRLGVPSIYEDGPMVRPWRLVLEEPVALENAKGQPGSAVGTRGVAQRRVAGSAQQDQTTETFRPVVQPFRL